MKWLMAKGIAFVLYFKRRKVKKFIWGSILNKINTISEP
jgi:hypothetical protein